MNEANLVNEIRRSNIKDFDAHSGCRSFRANLSELIDGELDPEQQAACELHAASCSVCEELLSQALKLVRSAASLADRPIPQAVSERLRKRLAEEGLRLDPLRSNVVPFKRQ